MNKGALTAHIEAKHTREFREKLGAMLRGAYDERPHSALEVGKVTVPAALSRAGLIGVTHVDIVPTQKDAGVALTKEMTRYSRSDAGNLRFEALTQISRVQGQVPRNPHTDERQPLRRALVQAAQLISVRLKQRAGAAAVFAAPGAFFIAAAGAQSVPGRSRRPVVTFAPGAARVGCVKIFPFPDGFLKGRHGRLA